MARLVALFTQGLFFGMLAVVIGSAIVAVVFLSRERRRRTVSPSFAPPVSVVIPAYNEERQIGRCLDALRADGYPAARLDLMVVDDGSTDGTREVVRAYPEVRLLRQDHAGKVMALNAGLRNAKHEFLLTIDADTRLRAGSIGEIVRPLTNPRVGAVTGVVKVGNSRGALGWFQSVEYLVNAFSRESFSSVFRVSSGVCGALTCYRRSALQQLGGFKAHTAAEDFDVALELVSGGFSIVATRGAVGYTQVPGTLGSLLRQRVRWMKGCMQCFVKHRALLTRGHPALRYLVASQIFWIVYALLSPPLMAYHFVFWLPDNTGSLLDVGFYVLRWASLAGPLYMLLKIPEWGISATYFGGVLAGVLSSLLMLVALRRYDRPTVRTALAILFYFPYTLLLSAMMMGSLAAYIRSGGKGGFVR